MAMSLSWNDRLETEALVCLTEPAAFLAPLSKPLVTLSFALLKASSVAFADLAAALATASICFSKRFCVASIETSRRA
ncbi:hypothetical protein [Aminobacter sp. BE110]|uniref:hypothetical protein n=1 Tax=unclassified Aminobacter TaxID=2644704 RepID=UPI003D24AEF7